MPVGVAFHHLPTQSDVRLFSPLTAVTVANILEQEVSKAKPCSRMSELDLEYLASLGLDGRLPEWRSEAKRLR